MNVLIIDNGTSFLENLKNSLTGCDISVINYFEIKNDRSFQADLIVLSGGHGYPVENNEDIYSKELSLIRNSSKPIIGICLGFELIVYAFDGELELMQKREKGTLEITLKRPLALFGDKAKVNVFESHRWKLKRLPKLFEEVATSKDGIEIIKHKILPIYGFQFHPEMNFQLSANELIDLVNM